MSERARMTPQPVGSAKSGFNWLIYGPPGYGKTVLLGTAKTLIIRPPTDHTDSILSINPGSKAEEVVPENWDEMREVYETIRHGQMTASDGKSFDYFSLDSISLWQEWGVDDLFEIAVQRKPTRGAAGPDKPEYGLNMYRLGDWVRDMVAEPINFIVTAHPQWNDRTEQYMPYVQGKNMPERICGYMNLVAYMQLTERGDKVYRILRTNATEEWYAKDQYDAFDGKIVNPTIPKMEEAIRNRRSGKSEGSTSTTRTRKRRTRSK